MKIPFAPLLTWALFLLLTRTVAGRSPSSRCYELIKSFEGLRLNAYTDVAGIWTIGYGIITYPNGNKVKRGESISLSQANNLLEWQVEKFARGVDSAVGSGVYLRQAQFDAPVSFSYVGLGALRRSTLLRLVKANPNNSAIRNEFMRWIYAGGRPVQGLRNRRQREANVYFS